MIGKITDVLGIKVGHSTNLEGLTGCTVILCEKGAVAGVDVRGSAPGTRETDLLNPINMVDKVHGILLAGGSAFGLDAATGVMKYLEERDCGFDVGVTKVPIVPGAVLFDLLIGDHKSRPNADMGYEACLNAREDFEVGNVGAGTGASVGKLLGMKSAMKAGIGTASMKIGKGIIVGAIVALNAFGDIYDPKTNEIIIGARKPLIGGYMDTVKALKGDLNQIISAFTNTTIGVIATNAQLTKAQATKVAQMAHNGYAAAIKPVHTMYDGDTIFALSYGTIKGDVNAIGYVAGEVMAQAIVNAAKSATPLGGYPAYKEK
jgi:L-aminopeptidase/D-esterase-like protein